MKKMIRGVFLVLLACLVAGPTVSGQITLTGLPAPSHGNLDYIGYFYSVSREGDFSAQVFPYTNLFIVSPTAARDTAESNWQQRFLEQLQVAASAGKWIHLLMADARMNQGAQEFSWDAVLDIADEFWSSVVFVEIFHENTGWGDSIANLSKQELESEIANLRYRITQAHSLDDRPILATWATVPGSLDAWEAEGLDIIGCSCYIGDDNQFEDTEEAISTLNGVLDTFVAAVNYVEKQAFMIMQAYDQSDVWQDMEMLTALQEAYYLHAADDDVVVGIGIFSYGRAGGTNEHPELAYPHQRIAWAAGLSGHPPGCTPGYGNCLGVDQWREADGYIQSKSGQYRLVYQTDGNLVLYDMWDSWYPVWASYQFHSPGYMQMQSDGNFVVYNAGSQAVLHTNTASYSGAYLYLDDTGNISVVLPSLNVAWRRGTLGCGGYGC